MEFYRSTPLCKFQNFKTKIGSNTDMTSLVDITIIRKLVMIMTLNV